MGRCNSYELYCPKFFPDKRKKMANGNHLSTYANMRGVRSVDRIVELCKRDLAFIWLTQGEQPGRDAFL